MHDVVRNVYLISFTTGFVIQCCRIS